MAEVKLVSTTREDHNANIVVGVQFVNMEGKDSNAKTVAEARLVSKTR